MELDFYRSSLESVALGLCIAAAFLLYKQQKHYSVIVIAIGFIITIITHISTNYCIGIALLTESLSNYPLLCSPIIPYIKALGYFMVGYGLMQLRGHLKNA